MRKQISTAVGWCLIFLETVVVVSGALVAVSSAALVVAGSKGVARGMMAIEEIVVALFGY